VKVYVFGPMCYDIPGQEIRFEVTEEGTLVAHDVEFEVKRSCTIMGWAVVLDGGRIWMGGLLNPERMPPNSTYTLMGIVADCNFDLPKWPAEQVVAGHPLLAMEYPPPPKDLS
jgi:hypothetical protein